MSINFHPARADWRLARIPGLDNGPWSVKVPADDFS